jgi:hypothetical protein
MTQGHLLRGCEKEIRAHQDDADGGPPQSEMGLNDLTRKAVLNHNASAVLELAGLPERGRTSKY